MNSAHNSPVSVSRRMDETPFRYRCSTRYSLDCRSGRDRLSLTSCEAHRPTGGGGKGPGLFVGPNPRPRPPHPPLARVSPPFFPASPFGGGVSSFSAPSLF